MIIILDIDRTLIDTEVISVARRSLMGIEYGILNTNQAESLNWDELLGRGLIYTDIIPFLTKARQQHNTRLMIFSEGDVDAQKLKLSKTGLDTFFDPKDIFLYPKDKELHFGEILDFVDTDANMDKTIIYIDDKISKLEAVKKIHGNKVITVWINRSNIRTVNFGLQNIDHIITSMADLDLI